jgi:uncharacterized protein YciI
MNNSTTIQVDGVPRFYVVFMTTRFRSLADVQQAAPEQLARHIRTSKRLHEQGRLLMAGAFLDQPDEPLRTMGVLTIYDDARQYAESDPLSKPDSWRTGTSANAPTSSAEFDQGRLGRSRRSRRENGSPTGTSGGRHVWSEPALMRAGSAHRLRVVVALTRRQPAVRRL